jgi:hypothetical protein
LISGGAVVKKEDELYTVEIDGEFDEKESHGEKIPCPQGKHTPILLAGGLQIRILRLIDTKKTMPKINLSR